MENFGRILSIIEADNVKRMELLLAGFFNKHIHTSEQKWVTDSTKFGSEMIFK